MRCGRQYEFASLNEVETALQFLIDKYPPLVVRLAKGPGTKEPRYAQLLAGEEILEQQASAEAFSHNSTILRTDRQDRMAALEDEVVSLRRHVEVLSVQFEEFKRQFE